MPSRTTTAAATADIELTVIAALYHSAGPLYLADTM